MRRLGLAVLTLAVSISLCACGGGNQTNIAELEKQISDMKDKKAEMGEFIEEQEAIIAERDETIRELNEQLAQYEDEYGWVISDLADHDFDSVIERLEEMKEEERKAEFAAKGIEEVVITLDNWNQYFESVPSGDAYLFNSFNEITHMNMATGIKLKDEFSMVENGGTVVNFEMETQKETRSCTVDFTTGTFEYGEVISQEGDMEIMTTRFNDNAYEDVAGFGSLTQVNNKNGNLVTQDVRIAGIVRMLRAEGVLYIYKN